MRAHLPELRVRREPEIVDEIAEHLSELYDEARRDGLAHDVALERARAALPARMGRFVGELRAAAEPLGAAHGRFRVVSDMRRDFRYGLRLVFQTPGFAAAIVVTLALGVGANAAIFTALDALLWRHAPVAAPEQLVHVYSATADGRVGFSSTSYPNYADLRDRGGFDGLAAYASIPMALDLAGTTRGVAALVVSGNYFDVLGVRLVSGRGFAPDEDRSGAPVHVVVLGHATWRNDFGGDPSIVGRPVVLNGRPYTVVGVAPPEFHGVTLGQPADFWVPLALQPEVRPPSGGLRRSLGSSNLLDARGPGWLNLVGRVGERHSRDEVRAALDVLARQLEAAHPDANRDRRFNIVALGEGPGVRTAVRPMLLALSVAVVLVLVIACGNVAGLLIVRALARQKEVAVRLALGASRSRLIRQWIAESAVFALLGAAGALLLAWLTTPLLYGFGIPASVDLSVNARVLAATLATALTSALLFGSIAIVHTLGGDTAHALREESRASTPAGARFGGGLASWWCK